MSTQIITIASTVDGVIDGFDWYVSEQVSAVGNVRRSALSSSSSAFKVAPRRDYVTLT